MKTHGTFKPADNSVEEKTNHLSERKIKELYKMADKVHEALVNRVLKAEVELRETGKYKEEEIPDLLQQLYDIGLKSIEDNCQSSIEQAIKIIRERREAGVGAKGIK